MRRGRVRAALQRLKLLDDIPRERVRDRIRRDTQVEARQIVGRILFARQRPDDIEQLLLGQPYQRPAQQRAERERVPAIRKDAGDRDEVLDLLAPVQALAGLGGDGDAALFQRFLVAPEIAPRRRQQGDVAGPARALPAVRGVGDRLAPDQARA